MLFTLLSSLILTQIFNPLFGSFERDIELKQALQGNKQEVQTPIRLNEENLGPKLTSRSAMVIDQDSREVLYELDIHAPLPVASISKLMTALVFIEQNPDLQENFTLNGTDTTGAGVRYIASGETLTLKDLLFTALIASDNNAAQSLVRASKLDYDEFIDQMNQKAQELGMLNTNFVEPTGLQYANISSAQDVALLLDSALEHELISDIISRSGYSFVSVSGQEHNLDSTNKLLSSYLNVIGGKTGFNDEAKFNLAAAVAGAQDQVLLVVSLGSQSPDARFDDVKAMAAWSFRNYIWP
jgi:D-alanyl-D-alanine carboxypeptidase